MAMGDNRTIALDKETGETVKFVVRNIYVDSSDCW